MSLNKKMSIYFSTSRMIDALFNNLTEDERIEAEGMGEPKLIMSVLGSPLGLVWEKEVK